MKKCLRYATNATIAATLTPEDGKCPAKLFSDENVVKCEDFVYKSNEQRLIQAVSDLVLYYFETRTLG